MAIRPTDPKPRRRALVALLLLAFAGAATLALVDRWPRDGRALTPADATARAEALLLVPAAILATAAILAAAGAIAIWRIGARTRATAQFPPPGVVVLRDVAIVTGKTATRRGRLIMAIGAILAICALALAIVAVWLVVWLRTGTR